MSKDDTCFSIDATNTLVSECAQEIQDEDLLSVLLRQRENPAQNMEVMTAFEKKPFLQPLMWKEIKKS